MRYKDFAIKASGDGDTGGFTGYAATFDREPDSYGDVIAPGAFDRTLKAWEESGKPVPLLYGHNMGDPDYNIGIAKLSVDDAGLLAEATFDGSAKAQRVRELVREGRLYKMSFAYDVFDETPVELDSGITANELRDLELFEVSVVLVPANQHAEILAAKTRAKYGAAISKANGDTLQGIYDGVLRADGELTSAMEELRPLLPKKLGPDEGDQTGDGADEGEGEEEPEAANSAAKSRELIEAINKALRD